MGLMQALLKMKRGVRNAEGVQSFSLGLIAPAIYPRSRLLSRSATLEGLNRTQQRFTSDPTPSGLRIFMAMGPRVNCGCNQPWAE